MFFCDNLCHARFIRIKLVYVIGRMELACKIYTYSYCGKPCHARFIVFYLNDSYNSP